jgi:fructosamine-3-kinase
MSAKLLSHSFMQVQQIMNADIIKTAPLHGGCIAAVSKVWLSDDRVIVVKSDDSKIHKTNNSETGLAIEGWMLGYLAQHSQLPVPQVFYSGSDLLIMEALQGESRFTHASQTHAAELLADLHNVSQPYYGLERDTLIGGLQQPNTQMSSWLAFFANERILFMAHRAYEEKKLPLTLLNRLEQFCERLSNWLMEPERPSLLHGDAWTTNVLAENNRITGFLDPAIYYGHAEIELAFTTLFDTFGEPFFKRYQEIRPIPDGFFELRRDLYNLYPLLVHVRLFGESYLSSIDATLKKVGC